MLRRAGLRLQIAFWVLLPIALLLAGVGLLMTLGAERLIQDMVRIRNNDLAQMAAAAVDHSLKRNLWFVQTVADMEARHLHAPAVQRQVLEASNDFLSRFDVGVALLDATGKVIATDPEHPQWMGIDLSSREYFQQVKASHQPVISSVMADILTQRNFVAMAVPILDEEGRFYQAVVGGFFLETRQFARELARLQGERPFTIYLVDKHGVIVHHPNPDRIGTDIRNEGVHGRLLAQAKPVTVVTQDTAQSELVVLSFAPIGDTGWGLFLSEPWTAVIAQTWRMITLGTSLLVLGFAGALGLTYFGIGQVTRPLAALERWAEDVAAGRNPQPFTPDGPRETQTLATTFNHMVGQLQENQRTLHEYAVAIMRNREEEYKHLARELHDETAQTLVALVQRLDLTKRALQTDPAKAARELGAVQELAEYILADVRRMSYNLRPLILEDLGLIAALQALTEDANQVYPACQTHFELIGTPRRLAAEEELIIFRIVQEAVNNACRHAYPEHVTVTLSFEPSEVRVVIEDDGCGFEMPPARELAHSGHLGLLGMQERAQLIGGQLEIQSSPGRGTRVIFQLRPS